LRANVKAARAGILGLEPRLQAEFEQELNKFYPLQNDPVWHEAFNVLIETYKQCQARCAERGIPKRFRPSIDPPVWRVGGYQMIRELRADMRRLAYKQIKTMVAERIEEQDRDAARVQLEILAHGCVTPVAKAFFDRLPELDDLIKPLSAKEVYGMLEGAPHLDYLPNSWEQRKLPEYQPDFGKGEENDD
jgi:hypothetical protein